MRVAIHLMVFSAGLNYKEWIINKLKKNNANLQLEYLFHAYVHMEKKILSRHLDLGKCSSA